MRQKELTRLCDIEEELHEIFERNPEAIDGLIDLDEAIGGQFPEVEPEFSSFFFEKQYKNGTVTLDFSPNYFSKEKEKDYFDKRQLNVWFEGDFEIEQEKIEEDLYRIKQELVPQQPL